MSSRARVSFVAMLATIGLLSCLPASHADSARDVDRHDVPTVRQVADIYPFLRGGSRSVSKHVVIELPRADCIYWRNGPVGRDGRWESFTTASGDDPYFAGYEAPSVFVYEFPGPRKSQAALGAVRRANNRCQGAHRASDGTLRRRRSVDVPRIGQSRPVAWREYARDPNTLTTWSYKRDLEIWTRKGRYVVRAWVQNETSHARVARGIRLARLATRTVG